MRNSPPSMFLIQSIRSSPCCWTSCFHFCRTPGATVLDHQVSFAHATIFNVIYNQLVSSDIVHHPRFMLELLEFLDLTFDLPLEVQPFTLKLFNLLSVFLYLVLIEILLTHIRIGLDWAKEDRLNDWFFHSKVKDFFESRLFLLHGLLYACS